MNSTKSTYGHGSGTSPLILAVLLFLQLMLMWTHYLLVQGQRSDLKLVGMPGEVIALPLLFTPYMNLG